MLFHAFQLVIILYMAATTVSTPTEPHPKSAAIAAIAARAPTCTPISANNLEIDDVPAIESALSKCGHGGVIVIPGGKTYSIRSTLSFAGCANCEFQIEGTLKASDDLTYWEGKTAIILMSGISSARIRSVSGTGMVDGNGQAAYDKFAADTSYKRPTLWYITGSTSITVENLSFRNAPNVFHTVNGNSMDVTYSNINLNAASSSTNKAKNTDGWDIGPASHISVTNAVVSNQDDCIAFKTGANYVSVNNISCTGSHGLSVGSLGSKPGIVDIVQNIHVQGADMSLSTKAVGIKLYPGGSQYGSAIVRNVTWDTVTVKSSDYAAQIQSCYSQTAAYCAANPSMASVTDIHFKNFMGTTSTKYEPVVANLDCSNGKVCEVYASAWSVQPPAGTAKFLCANVDSTIGVACSSGASG